MNSLAIAVRPEPALPAEVQEALDNIKSTMKIQSEKGNKEAVWILKHL